jgi:lipopolysaccharide export system permease protein
MSVLSRYLTGRLAFHTGLVLVGLVSMMLSFELLEQGDRILNATGGDTWALVRYGGLRLPEIAAAALPMASLLGVLVTVSLLSRHAELIALWSSGVSSLRLLRAVLPAALVLGALQFALEDRLVPAALDELHAWGVASRDDAAFAHAADAVWVVSGTDIVRIPRTAGRRGSVSDITIFRRDAEGALQERISAARATAAGDGWHLYDARVVDVATAAVRREPALFWRGRIDAENLPLIAKRFSGLTVHDLGRLIAGDGFGQQPAYLARTWLHARLAGALTPALMIAVVLSLAQWKGRTGGLGALLLLSLSIGFGYLVLDRTALALGESGLLPPWFAGIGIKGALVGLTGWLFLRAEG